jgi:hypothetical protein
MMLIRFMRWRRSCRRSNEAGVHIRGARDERLVRLQGGRPITGRSQGSLTGSRLQISGKRDEEKETKNDTFYTYERSYGDFTRSFTLPDGVDTEHVKTELRDGVLTLVIPKRAEAMARNIPITSGTKS